MTRAVTFTQAQVRRAVKAAEPVVYFVQIGKHIKIGFTTNLRQRLKSFLTSSPDVELLLTIPGDRSLEQTLHEKLDECRIARELFRREWRVLNFISMFERFGLDQGLRFLDETDPLARTRKKAEDYRQRIAIAKQSRAEKDAYFASLVAERKQKIGW